MYYYYYYFPSFLEVEKYTECRGRIPEHGAHDPKEFSGGGFPDQRLPSGLSRFIRHAPEHGKGIPIPPQPPLPKGKKRDIHHKTVSCNTAT